MSLNVVFMGTPEFAVPSLENIIKSKYIIKAVYSQPPKKSNRGMKIEKSPIQLLAEKNQLLIRTPESLEKDFEFFKNLNIDLVIVVAYGQIISKQFLKLSKYGFLNIHASILPKWRGAAPIQRSIMAQDNTTGISIMKIEEKLDSGPILLLEKIKLDSQTTAGKVEEYLSAIGGKKILDAIQLIENKKTNFTKQDHNKATYAKKIKKEDAEIDWNKSSKEIVAKIYGLNPKPGAFFQYKEQKIKIWKAEHRKNNAEPGKVLDNQLNIACGKDSIQVLEIQRPGKKIQKIKEFLLGFSIPKNTRL